MSKVIANCSWRVWGHGTVNLPADPGQGPGGVLGAKSLGFSGIFNFKVPTTALKLVWFCVFQSRL